MSQRNLTHFYNLIQASISCLPDDIEPQQIARTLVDGAGASDRCDVQLLFNICRNDLDAMSVWSNSEALDRTKTMLRSEVAIESLRGSLALLITGALAQGASPEAIAKILGQQAATVLNPGDPLVAEMFADAADHLPHTLAA